LSRQYHILTRDDRLETIAKDIVAHFLGRGFVGKAMVVSIDKATALRMHDKVRKHWAAEDRVEREAELEPGRIGMGRQARLWKDAHQGARARPGWHADHRHGADRLARPERDRADEGSTASTSCRTASG
jgi:hypothetical protein